MLGAGDGSKRGIRIKSGAKSRSRPLSQISAFHFHFTVIPSLAFKSNCEIELCLPSCSGTSEMMIVSEIFCFHQASARPGFLPHTQ